MVNKYTFFLTLHQTFDVYLGKLYVTILVLFIRFAVHDETVVESDKRTLDICN